MREGRKRRCSSVSKPPAGSVLHNTLFRGKLEKASSFESILDGEVAGFPGLWLFVLTVLGDTGRGFLYIHMSEVGRVIFSSSKNE